jgi:hypothetical protein
VEATTIGREPRDRCSGASASPRRARGWLVAAAAVAAAGPAAATERPGARGYLTTPLELSIIAAKADEGIEPYASSRAAVLARAAEPWSWGFSAHETCPNADTPAWNDNSGGTRVTYANALAYHLTGNASYASLVRTILQAAMSQVLDFGPDCDTNLGWGAPELVASADLIEDYWEGLTCSGPLTPTPGDPTLGSGPCKRLFQNWLAKAVYPVISEMASASQNNRGASGTTTAAFVADYLWDRDDVVLVHENPSRINDGEPYLFTPAQAFAHARQLALDRMNGYAVDLGNSSCDYLGGVFQAPQFAPVKSQITPGGIIPEDARRDEYCNIPFYDGTYQNYPQGHIGNNLQQCELLLRRGDRSCYDNEDPTNLPSYSFVGPDDVLHTTPLKPGRGSLERAIKAIVVDSSTEWRHDPALEVAYQYYRHYGRQPGIGAWPAQIDERDRCMQNFCLTTLTHGFALDFPLKALDAPAGGEAVLVDVPLQGGGARVPLEYAACAEPVGAVNAVRGVGTPSGLAFWRDRLYGLESAGADAYLFELPPSVCAEGARVGTGAVGFAGLESLAACPDGSLYSADWDPAARRARLVRIDRATGLGATAGSHTMAQDLRIVGLGCASDGGSLWAVTSGAAGRPPELLTVDPATGIESVVGPTGTPNDALQALELDRSSATPRLLAAGSALYELDPATGAAGLLGGSFGGVRALAMPEPMSGPDSDRDGWPDPEDNCRDVANPDQADSDQDGFGSLCDGDFNNDGATGAPDVVMFARAFGTMVGDPAYDPDVDMTSDGGIGAPDVVLFVSAVLHPPGPSGLACAGTVPCP